MNAKTILVTTTPHVSTPKAVTSALASLAIKGSIARWTSTSAKPTLVGTKASASIHTADIIACA